jgi:hypothetical protein
MSTTFGSEKREKRKPVDELMESQRGAMDRFFFLKKYKHAQKSR